MGHRGLVTTQTMSFEVPAGLRYAETHEWIDADRGRVGITDFAQHELGAVIFVEFDVEEGDGLAAGEEFGSIESMKADAELYAPVAGEVDGVNTDLVDAPERVNDDPYGRGWMLALDVADPRALEALLDADAYRERTA